MRRSSLSLSLLSLLAASAAVAQQPAWESGPSPRVISDQMGFELGTLLGNVSTEVRVDEAPDAQGTLVSAEDDFGLDDVSVLAMPELTLFPGERNLLRLSSLSIRRHATKAMEREIIYEGDVFAVGDVVDSSLDIQIIGLTYGYQLLRKPDYSLALTGGIQVVDVENNAQVQGQMPREPSGDLAPVPVLGIEAQFGLRSCCTIELRAQYSQLEVEEIEGSMLDARLGVVWHPNPHLALGLGYRNMHLEAESFSEDSAGLVNFRLTGPFLFARATL